jgi:hypothetical protein
MRPTHGISVTSPPLLTAISIPSFGPPSASSPTRNQPPGIPASAPAKVAEQKARYPAEPSTT